MGRFIAAALSAFALAWLQFVPPADAQTNSTASAPAPASRDVSSSPQGTGTPPAPASGATLDGAQQALSQLQNQAMASSNDAQLASMLARAALIQSQAQTVAAARLNDIAAVDKAIKPPAGRGKRPASLADRNKQAALAAQRAGLAVQLGQAQSIVGSASSTYNLIAERRREGFSARVLARSDSPLSPGFWASLRDTTGADLERLALVAQEAESAAINAPEPTGLAGLGIAACIAAILVFPVRRKLESLGRNKAAAAHSRFGHSGDALWTTLVNIGLPVLAAVVVHLAGQWCALLSDKADAVADAIVITIGWACAILTLGRVLATDADPERRLLAVSDEAARRVRPPLFAVALITAVGFLLSRLNYVVGASVAATIASNCILSLAYAAVAGLILLSFGRSADKSGARPAGEVARNPVWTLVSLFLWGAVTVTVAAVFAGYTTLAALISSQIFWLSILAAVAYVLLRFVDDLFNAFFGQDGRAARTLSALFNLRRSAVRQTALLVSAACQVVILVVALSLALTPYGQSGDLFLTHFTRVGSAIGLGSAKISPAAIAAGLATLMAGVAIAHVVQRWVVKRYLPLTEWDAGLRNSVTTGVGYIGVGVAFICAMAAMGLGFQQIALIASALSVGIGFGLQQIVQNFVSGVILLVERPVEVGDWVSVDGVEGDVCRIRVRATEIRTFDKSTVIVPNSDLITKSVRNNTLGNAYGRILLPLSIANPADALKAKALILKTGATNPKILQDPAPAVYIDSVAAGGAVNFNCYFYVANPRDSYSVRSELYFDLLAAFIGDNIAFVGTAGPQTVSVEPGPIFQTFLDSVTREPRPATGSA